MYKCEVAPWRQGTGLRRLLEGQAAGLVSTCVHNNRMKEQGNGICFSSLPAFPPILLSPSYQSPTPTLKPLSQECSLHILGNLSTLKGCFSSDSLQIQWHFLRKQESCLMFLGDPHKAKKYSFKKTPNSGILFPLSEKEKRCFLFVCLFNAVWYKGEK